MKLRDIAEARMKRAEADGAFRDLKGAGKPLPRRTDGNHAEEIGYRIMAEAGAVPEEIRLRNAVEAQRKVLAATVDSAERKHGMAKLADLEMRLAIQEEARRRTERNR